jgi:hypothetical protein
MIHNGCAAACLVAGSQGRVVIACRDAFTPLVLAAPQLSCLVNFKWSLI